MTRNVNDEITDAVTRANVKTGTESPAMAIGTGYPVSANVTGRAPQKASEGPTPQPPRRAEDAPCASAGD